MRLFSHTLYKLEKSAVSKPTALVFVKLLIGNSRMLDTLYQEVLAESIENNQRCNDHKTTSITNSGLIKCLTCISQLQGRRNSTNQVNQELIGSIKTGVNETYIEVISPLPAECKQEYGNHHGDGKRQDDLDESTESTTTIHICRFFKLIRNSTEELTEHENIQAVLKCHTGCR